MSETCWDSLLELIWADLCFVICSPLGVSDVVSVFGVLFDYVLSTKVWLF